MTGQGEGCSDEVPRIRKRGCGCFAFECVNPMKTRFTQTELLELEEHINSHYAGVVVNSLQVVTKEVIKKLKEGEEEKRYTALCLTAELCQAYKTCHLEILQKTGIWLY